MSINNPDTTNKETIKMYILTEKQQKQVNAILEGRNIDSLNKLLTKVDGLIDVLKNTTSRTSSQIKKLKMLLDISTLIKLKLG